MKNFKNHNSINDDYEQCPLINAQLGSRILGSLMTIRELLEFYQNSDNIVNVNIQQQELLDRSKAAIVRLYRSIDDAISLDSAERNQLSLNPTIFDLSKFYHQLITELQQKDCIEHQLRVQEYGDRREVCLDARLLKIIMSNLLADASKFSPGSQTVDTAIHYENEQVTFEVYDTGVGIPINEQKVIFEPMRRASNAKEFSGIGIGLSVVKKCVELHQGTIEVKSELEKGTKFTVILPYLL